MEKNIAELVKRVRGYLKFVGITVVEVANSTGKVTKRTTVLVFELINDRGYREIFHGFRKSLDSLCLSKEEIGSFVHNHEAQFPENAYGMFFLNKWKRVFCVANISMYQGVGKLVYSLLSKNHCLWHAENKHRVVIAFRP